MHRELTRTFRLPTTRLSPKQTIIAEMICDGLQSKEIALKMGISKKTVEAQRYLLYQKLGVHTALELYKIIRGTEFAHNAT